MGRGVGDFGLCLCLDLTASRHFLVLCFDPSADAGVRDGWRRAAMMF